METYSIAQVEALTGIQAHTIRIWEKRYGFIEPSRSKTNIRFYTGQQLKALLNTSVLLSHGYKISKIAKLSEEEILKSSFESQSITSSRQAEIKALILSMLELNEHQFEQTFRLSLIKSSLLETITDVIYPFLKQVGILWGTNQTAPAQEHFISNLIKKKLFSAIDLLPSLDQNEKSVVLFLPPREEHELGLLLAYYLFKNAGWKVYYLGSNVPIENLKSIEEIATPDYFYTFIINPLSSVFKNFINRDKVLKTPILYSGNVSLLKDKKIDRVVTINSPQDLLEFIDQQ